MPSRAVIIGSGDYESDLTSYRTITESARCYGEVLRRNRLWQAEDAITVLSSEGGRQLTINSVMDAVQGAADETGEGDSLLVVYIGHGAYWSDLPGAEVHFAVTESRKAHPYTWLSSYYIYRAIRKSKASLKVLVADCCYSNYLDSLGAETDDDRTPPGILSDKGTCVLTATSDKARATPNACDSRNIEEQFRKCTPFSGHLLDIMSRGLQSDRDLTLGMLHRAVHAEMTNCVNHNVHGTPGIRRNDYPDDLPLLANNMPADDRRRLTPISDQQWFEAIRDQRNFDLNELLREPDRTGRVVAMLSDPGRGAGRNAARDVIVRADERYRSEPDLFARYYVASRGR